MSNASKISALPTIERVFDLLDRWRHLPAYQLERRADIFFALFLAEVLGKHFKIVINPILVPEFPIKHKGDNTSNKADYLALSGDGKRAFLIELKTDITSRRKKQDKYLCDAVGVGLKKLVEGVLEIYSVSKQKPKYVHLLYLLSKISLIEYEDGLFPVEKGYSEVLNRIKGQVEKRRDWPSLEVVYIQPRTNIIDFKEFADAIEMGEGEGIRSLFAERLRKWAVDKAGSLNPKDWRSC